MEIEERSSQKHGRWEPVASDMLTTHTLTVRTVLRVSGSAPKYDLLLRHCVFVDSAQRRFYRVRVHR